MVDHVCVRGEDAKMGGTERENFLGVFAVDDARLEARLLSPSPRGCLGPVSPGPCAQQGLGSAAWGKVLFCSQAAW